MWPKGKTIQHTTALAKKTGILRGPLWGLAASGAILATLATVHAAESVQFFAGILCLLSAINVFLATFIPVWRRDYVALCTEEVQKKALEVGRFGSDDNIIDATATDAEPGMSGEAAAQRGGGAPRHPMLKAANRYAPGPEHGGHDA